jgi:hypothetical protein
MAPPVARRERPPRVASVGQDPNSTVPTVAASFALRFHDCFRQHHRPASPVVRHEPLEKSLSVPCAWASFRIGAKTRVEAESHAKCETVQSCQHFAMRIGRTVFIAPVDGFFRAEGDQGEYGDAALRHSDEGGRQDLHDHS